MKIHDCDRECRHAVARPNGFIVQRHGTREEHEADIIAKARGRRVEYLGSFGPDHGDDKWAMPAWRIGAKPFKLTPRVEDEGTPSQSRNVKVEYRREVWEGSGLPVGPVDLSRPAEPEAEAFPAPLLTSTDDQEGFEASGPARTLLGYAAGLSWLGVITRAEGWVPHATHGRPSARPKTSEAVRLARGTQRAVAVRMDGSWASLWTWSPERFFTRHGTLEAFKQELI